MTDFNKSFLDHLKRSEIQRNTEFLEVVNPKKGQYKYPVDQLLKKYKYKLWRNRQKLDISKRHNKIRFKQTSWTSTSNSSNETHSFHETVLPDISPCKDFPITEIEVTGNRNNGNSPFNSSSSCNSPPDAQVEKTFGPTAVNRDCIKCQMTNSEQNNNMDLQCTCLEKTDHRNSEIGHMDTEISEPYIDVESFDDSGEKKNENKITEVFDDGIKDEQVQYVASKGQQSSVIPPVKWQQQFMSFLSTTSTNDEDETSEKSSITCTKDQNVGSEKSSITCTKDQDVGSEKSSITCTKDKDVGSEKSSITSTKDQDVTSEQLSTTCIKDQENSSDKLSTNCTQEKDEKMSASCTKNQENSSEKSSTTCTSENFQEDIECKGEVAMDIDNTVGDNKCEKCDEKDQFMECLKGDKPYIDKECLKSKEHNCKEENECMEDENEGILKHHSPRRKRSRKIRQSSCPCCLGSGHHHKKDMSEEMVQLKKAHSLMRSQRRFIRDMTQLVSLRNKVMEVCRVLFPLCAGELFNYASSDSEDVDKCVDQMITILHNAHQQFLQNLNKAESTRKFKKETKFKTEFTGNLQYDQIDKNEYVVSILDPSKEKGNPSQITEEADEPPFLFCQQSDQLPCSEPDLLTNLCLPENEGIVYAIPVEDGIAYPEKTQVLMTDVEEPLFPNSKLLVQNNEDHNQILSEADSGIVVNDHDISSPEECDKDKVRRSTKCSSVWEDTMDKSKTSPLKAEQTANIFDLLANYEPKKSVKSDQTVSVSESSPEVKTNEQKSPVKGDRNIFESLFSMNVNTPASPQPQTLTEDEICDQEIQSYYLPLDNSENNGSTSEVEDHPQDMYIEVYDPAIVLCKKPKICLTAFKEKVATLLKWLLPEITFDKNFFKNSDNLEYVLDAVLLSNRKDGS